MPITTSATTSGCEWRWPCSRAALPALRPLVRADLFPTSVEQSFVVSLANLGAGVRREQRPQRLVHVEYGVVRNGVARSDDVGAEQEAVGVAVDQIRRATRDLGRGEQILGDFVPADVEVHVPQAWVLEDVFDDHTLVGIPRIRLR